MPDPCARPAGSDPRERVKPVCSIRVSRRTLHFKSAERSSEFRLTAPFAADKPQWEDGLGISTEKLGIELCMESL